MGIQCVCPYLSLSKINNAFDGFHIISMPFGYIAFERYFCRNNLIVYSKEEKKKLVENFWEGFTLFSNRMPLLKWKEKKWMLHRTKLADVHLKFEPGREGIKVILEISHRDVDKRLEQFEKILQYKVILEEGFEDGLIWDYAYTRDTGQEVCWIYVEKKGLDWHRQSQWEEIYTFMADNMQRLENNFLEIRDLIRL